MNANELKAAAREIIRKMEYRKHFSKQYNSTILGYIHTPHSESLLKMYEEKLTSNQMEVLVFYIQEELDKKLVFKENVVKAKQNVKQFQESELGSKIIEFFEITWFIWVLLAIPLILMLLGILD